LAAQVSKTRDAVRADCEAQGRQFSQSLARETDAAMETYKGRLENASNAWLLTTAAKLNQQSEEQIEAMARSAEEKLRETFSQVFSTVGESLRQRLVDFSSSLPTSFAKKPEEK